LGLQNSQSSSPGRINERFESRPIIRFRERLLHFHESRPRRLFLISAQLYCGSWFPLPLPLSFDLLKPVLRLCLFDGHSTALVLGLNA
jgi:hypothetical protein